MIAFELPLALLGLGLLVLPIALHALVRRAPPVLLLPTARFLDEVPRPRRRVSWPRDLLVLACRLLGLAALVVAAGRPFVRGEARESAAAPPLVLVLDDSLSMAHGAPRTRFDRAREKLLARLDALAPGARAALLTTSQPRASLEPASAVRERLGALAPAPRTGQLLPALEHAAALAREAPGAHVVLASDLDRASLEGIERRSDPARGLALDLVDVGDDLPRNAWLSSLELHPQTPVAGFPLEVRARLSAVGLDPTLEVPVTLELGGERRETRACPGQVVSFRIARPAAGRLEGTLRARAPGDALPLDDAVSFTALVRDRLPVVVSGEEAAQRDRDDEPVTRALDALAAAQGAAIDARVRAPSELARSLGNARVLVLASPGALDGLAVQAIASFVARGGGLVVFADERTRPEALRALAAAGALPGVASIAEADAAEAPIPEEGRFAPELARGLAALDLAPQTTLEPAPGAVVVLRDGRGRPLWVERGRTALVGFAAAGRNASLETETAFPLIVGRALRTALGGWAPLEVPAGEALDRSELAHAAGVPLAELAGAKLVQPDGVERPLGEGAIVPATPGVYRVLSRAGEDLAVFAARCPESESALERASSTARAALVERAPVAARVPVDHDRRDVTVEVAAAGLALLFLASLLSNRRLGPEPEPRPAPRPALAGAP